VIFDPDDSTKATGLLNLNLDIDGELFNVDFTYR